MVRSVLSPRRPALLTLLVFLAFAAPAAAHEGHDHGAPPAVVAAALPRTEAHTDLFEVVAVLQPGGALVITLDRYADNVPLDGAITLTLDGQELPTERQGLGLFVLRHPRLEQPGPGRSTWSSSSPPGRIWTFSPRRSKSQIRPGSRLAAARRCWNCCVLVRSSLASGSDCSHSGSCSAAPPSGGHCRRWWKTPPNPSRRRWRCPAAPRPSRWVRYCSRQAPGRSRRSLLASRHAASRMAGSSSRRHRSGG
jgi:hypothetical protein